MEHLNAHTYSSDLDLRIHDLAPSEEQDIRTALECQGLVLLVVDGRAVGGVTSAALDRLNVWADERSEEKLLETKTAVEHAVDHIQIQAGAIGDVLAELEGTLHEKLLKDLTDALDEIKSDTTKLEDAIS